MSPFHKEEKMARQFFVFSVCLCVLISSCLIHGQWDDDDDWGDKNKDKKKKDLYVVTKSKHCCKPVLKKVGHVTEKKTAMEKKKKKDDDYRWFFDDDDDDWDRRRRRRRRRSIQQLYYSRGRMDIENFWNHLLVSHPPDTNYPFPSLHCKVWNWFSRLVSKYHSHSLFFRYGWLPLPFSVTNHVIKQELQTGTTLLDKHSHPILLFTA